MTLVVTAALLLASACNSSKLDIVINSLSAAAALTQTLDISPAEQRCAGEGFRVAQTALVTYKAHPGASTWSAVVGAITNLHTGDCIRNDRLHAIASTLQAILATIQPATPNRVVVESAPTPSDFNRVLRSDLDRLEELTKKN